MTAPLALVPQQHSGHRSDVHLVKWSQRWKAVGHGLPVVRTVDERRRPKFQLADAGGADRQGSDGLPVNHDVVFIAWLSILDFHLEAPFQCAIVESLLVPH